MMRAIPFYLPSDISQAQLQAAAKLLGCRVYVTEGRTIVAPHIPKDTSVIAYLMEQLSQQIDDWHEDN